MAGYSTGLLGCLEDKPSCVDSICCYPCQIGFQFGALNGSEGMSPLHCLLSAIGAFQCCICLLRRKVDETYNVGEGCIVSFCIAYICPQCSLCQTHREIKARSRAPGGICVKILGGALPGMNGDRISAGEEIAVGGEIKSKSSGHRVCMQTDGNLVVYNSANGATWASNTSNQTVTKCVMQADGNLVLYNGTAPVWASNTSNSGGNVLIMQDDGNLVIYKADGTSAVWATGTNGR
jgi:Cys-rich protein (TIGR01571 family)